MQKITNTARIIDIFSAEPIEQCLTYLEMAQRILRNRQGRQTPKTRRRSRPEVVTPSEGVGRESQ